MTLEKVLIPNLKNDRIYSLRAFELWGDESEGYSVNSAWTFARNLSKAEALAAARDRFEIYKLNYAPKVRIKDLEIEGNYQNEASFSLVHNGLPVVEFYQTEGAP